MLRKGLEIVIGAPLANQLLGHVPKPSVVNKRRKLERDLINQEAKIGAWVLGDIPEGHTRSFFCLDSHTWIWNEQWYDNDKKLHTMHIQYDVRSDGILKRINGGDPVRVTGQELLNFDRAVTQYYHHVSAQVYGRSVAVA